MRQVKQKLCDLINYYSYRSVALSSESELEEANMNDEILNLFPETNIHLNLNGRWILKGES